MKSSSLIGKPNYLQISNKIIGETFKDYRESNDLMQKEVAEFLRCDRTRISKIEIGRVTVSFLEIVLFCEMIEIDLDQFYNTIKKKLTYR